MAARPCIPLIEHKGDVLWRKSLTAQTWPLAVLGRYVVLGSALAARSAGMGNGTCFGPDWWRTPGIGPGPRRWKR
jgi:hypothetical protein